MMLVLLQLSQSPSVDLFLDAKLCLTPVLLHWQQLTCALSSFCN